MSRHVFFLLNAVASTAILYLEKYPQCYQMFPSNIKIPYDYEDDDDMALDSPVEATATSQGKPVGPPLLEPNSSRNWITNIIR